MNSIDKVEKSPFSKGSGIKGVVQQRDASFPASCLNVNFRHETFFSASEDYGKNLNIKIPKLHPCRSQV